MRNVAFVGLKVLILAFLAINFSCTKKEDDTALRSKADSLQLALDRLLKRIEIGSTHLSRIDSLHVTAFTQAGQEAFTKLHGKSVIVFWPDGRRVSGLSKHVEEIKNAFHFAPDIKVVKNNNSFGSGDWTCTLGMLSGTFSKPLVYNNRTVNPTGKQFSLPVCTVTHWIDNQVADEFLYWDNHALLQQIGAL